MSDGSSREPRYPRRSRAYPGSGAGYPDDPPPADADEYLAAPAAPPDQRRPGSRMAARQARGYQPTSDAATGWPPSPERDELARGYAWAPPEDERPHRAGTRRKPPGAPPDRDLYTERQDRRARPEPPTDFRGGAPGPGGGHRGYPDTGRPPGPGSGRVTGQGYPAAGGPASPDARGGAGVGYPGSDVGAGRPAGSGAGRGTGRGYPGADPGPGRPAGPGGSGASGPVRVPGQPGPADSRRGQAAPGPAGWDTARRGSASAAPAAPPRGSRSAEVGGWDASRRGPAAPAPAGQDPPGRRVMAPGVAGRDAGRGTVPPGPARRAASGRDTLPPGAAGRDAAGRGPVAPGSTGRDAGRGQAAPGPAGRDGTRWSAAAAQPSGRAFAASPARPAGEPADPDGQGRPGRSRVIPGTIEPEPEERGRGRRGRPGRRGPDRDGADRPGTDRPGTDGGDAGQAPGRGEAPQRSGGLMPDLDRLDRVLEEFPDSADEGRSRRRGLFGRRSRSEEAFWDGEPDARGDDLDPPRGRGRAGRRGRADDAGPRDRDRPAGPGEHPDGSRSGSRSARPAGPADAEPTLPPRRSQIGRAHV